MSDSNNGGIAIIGGTGVASLELVDWSDSVSLSTPFGAVSGPVAQGTVNDRSVFFLNRHGNANIPPHSVNYRANIHALKQLGADRVVAINAVGGITADMHPGRLVIPDQLIDYTWGREHTFDEGGQEPLQHIDFTDPYDRALRRALLDAAETLDMACCETATYGVTQGPRLETAAEIGRMRRDGCDLVGMTAMPEAALAREAGMAYASVCMVVNPAAGIGELPITMDMMRTILEREVRAVTGLLACYLSRL
jgi:5'-methylthioinosine phosphorylase